MQAHWSFPLTTLFKRKKWTTYYKLPARYSHIPYRNFGTLGTLCSRWYRDRSWRIEYAFTDKDYKDSGKVNWNDGEEERRLILKLQMTFYPNCYLGKSLYVFLNFHFPDEQNGMKIPTFQGLWVLCVIIYVKVSHKLDMLCNSGILFRHS